MNNLSAKRLAEFAAWHEKIRILVEEFGKLPQIECPLKHYFAPGCYVREIFMPADSIIIGRIHKTEHFNIMQQGRVTLINDDYSSEILIAPLTFVSKAGVQKVLYIHENTVWSTVHLTEETDLVRLETQLVEPVDYLYLEGAIEKLEVQL